MAETNTANSAANKTTDEEKDVFDLRNAKIMQDTTPELNMLNPKNPNYGKIKLPEKRKLPKLPTETPGTGDYGTTIYATSGVFGAAAKHYIQTGLSLPENQTNDQLLYAPTLEAPNYAPLESVTIYFNPVGSGDVTYRQWGTWNHSAPCPPCWDVIKSMDSAWQANYTTTDGDGRYYLTIVYKPGGSGSNTWQVLLYNFTSTWWEIQDEYTGSTQRSDGWDMFEETTGWSCPSLPQIRSKDVKVYLNSQAYPVTWLFGETKDYQSCSYTEEMVSNYYHWRVN